MLRYISLLLHFVIIDAKVIKLSKTGIYLFQLDSQSAVNRYGSLLCMLGAFKLKRVQFG